MWGDDSDPILLADLCGKVWDLAHLTVSDIRAHTGLTQAAFSERFLIPYRTLQNWEAPITPSSCSPGCAVWRTAFYNDLLLQRRPRTHAPPLPEVEGVDAGEVWGIERDPQRDFPAALDLKAILSLIAFYVG